MSEEQGEVASTTEAGEEPATETTAQQEEGQEQPEVAPDEQDETSVVETQSHGGGEGGENAEQDKPEEVVAEKEGEEGKDATVEQAAPDEGEVTGEQGEEGEVTGEQGGEGEATGDQAATGEAEEGKQEQETAEESAAVAEDSEKGGSDGGEGDGGEGNGGEGDGGEGDGGEGDGGKGDGGEGDDGEVKEEKGEVEEVQQPEEAEAAEPTPTQGTESEEVGVASAGTSLPDGRLASVSRMAIQSTVLENITEEVEVEEEGEEEEEEEEEEIDRDELIQSCKEAVLVQSRLRSENAQLQHKIAEYLSHKKVEEKPDPGRNVTDQEKRYLKCISALEQLQAELCQLQAQWVEREEQVKKMCENKQREVQEETGEFLVYQREGASQAVDSRSGRRLNNAEICRMQAEHESHDQAVFQARLENIKLANKIERQEALLKQKEELADGLHMIDFEQLKISNVDLTEKVEERNEDISKLTRKVRGTVEVLTHVKEKLHFLQGENSKKKDQLDQLDSELAKNRDVLTRLKQARDSLRLDNQRLRQRGGLVCHSTLLADFEERQDQNVELQGRLEQLRSQHSQNSLQCGGLRRKIEQARQLQHHLH